MPVLTYVDTYELGCTKIGNTTINEETYASHFIGKQKNLRVEKKRKKEGNKRQ